MSIHIPCVSSAEELFEFLRHIDISVPARTEGRLSDHTETWTGARLLSTLANAHRLQYPLSVVHRDRPDLLLHMIQRKVGAEITEAVGKQYSDYCALAEREFPDAVLEPAQFRWGSPHRTVEQLRAMLRSSSLTAPAWIGDAPEREWAFFMQDAVNKKLGKLSSEGFAKFDQNWLAIYDNLPKPKISIGKALSFLLPLLNDSWSSTPHFDEIFIEHHQAFIRITKDAVEHLKLHDIW